MTGAALVHRNFWTGVAVLAVLLGLLGLLLWLAANWDNLGSVGQAALLQLWLAGNGIAALRSPRGRPLFALFAFGGVGLLLAWLDQTYPSSAASWQLFALWTILALPLCLALRSDLLCLAWALTWTATMFLWLDEYLPPIGINDRPSPMLLYVHAILASGVLVLTLSPLLHRYSGASIRSLRGGLTLAAAVVVYVGFDCVAAARMEVAYFLALGALAVATVAFARQAPVDVYCLSLLALALDILLVFGVLRFLATSWVSSDITLLAGGLVGMFLLVVSVQLILRLARRQPPGAGAGA